MARKRSTLHPATERAILTWAAQKRLMYVGGDGFAPASVLAKIRDEREGAGEGHRPTQHWAEVYTGDGLAVHKVTLTMTDVPRGVMTAYYLMRADWFVPANKQAAYFGLETREYWDALRLAENIVECGLRLLEELAQPEPARSRETGPDGVSVRCVIGEPPITRIREEQRLVDALRPVKATRK